jgi:hypothetical protein
VADGVIEVRMKFNKSEKGDEELYQFLESIPTLYRSYELGKLLRQLFPLRDKLIDRIVEHP